MQSGIVNTVVDEGGRRSGPTSTPKSGHHTRLIVPQDVEESTKHEQAIRPSLGSSGEELKLYCRVGSSFAFASNQNTASSKRLYSGHATSTGEKTSCERGH